MINLSKKELENLAMGIKLTDFFLIFDVPFGDVNEAIWQMKSAFSGCAVELRPSRKYYTLSITKNNMGVSYG